MRCSVIFVEDSLRFLCIEMNGSVKYIGPRMSPIYKINIVSLYTQYLLTLSPSLILCLLSFYCDNFATIPRVANCVMCKIILFQPIYPLLILLMFIWPQYAHNYDWLMQNNNPSKYINVNNLRDMSYYQDVFWVQLEAKNFGKMHLDSLCFVLNSEGW